MRYGLLITLLIPLATFAGERTVNADEFGDDWPFTVTEGILKCDGLSITFKAGSTTYAVNGTAGMKGYDQIDPIWADVTQTIGDVSFQTKADIGPITEAGQELCD